MSYDEALADLKEQFGSENLETEEVAAAIGRSREATAMMHLRKQFPACQEIGGRVVVSIYDLARFLSDSSPASEALGSAVKNAEIQKAKHRPRRRLRRGLLRSRRLSELSASPSSSSKPSLN